MRRTISLGNGCISSLNGIVDYIDDGNGNEWAAWDDEDNEH